MKKSNPPQLTRFPAAKQRRLDRLLETNNEGDNLQPGESELEQLVADPECLMVVYARRPA
jgi:hypothetical protein